MNNWDSKGMHRQSESRRKAENEAKNAVSELGGSPCWDYESDLVSSSEFFLRSSRYLESFDFQSSATFAMQSRTFSHISTDLSSILRPNCFICFDSSLVNGDGPSHSASIGILLIVFAHS